MKVGIDILDVVRMEKFVQNEHFLDKYFTEYEIAYVSRTRRTTQSLAGIYSAKEAFLKALGIGIGGGIALNEIEIRHENTGKPYISLTSSKANIMIKTMGVEAIEINISHTDEVCTAVCLLKMADD